MSPRPADTQVIVVGGGLAGLSAVVEARRSADVTVTLIEKMHTIGGNSAKATDGISAVSPDQGDTAERFREDTLASGGGLCSVPLVQKLVDESNAALKFVQSLGVDMSNVHRCAAHSLARTHRGQASVPNVGACLIRALAAAVAADDKVQVLTDAQVMELMLDDAGAVVGVRARVGDRRVSINASAIILATGGFATPCALLRAHAPHLGALPSTNGPFAVGDGVRLGLAAGAGTVHMDRVQLYPTAFVDPLYPDASSKLIAPAGFRGCGGLLVTEGGRRFVNEYAKRRPPHPVVARPPAHRPPCPEPLADWRRGPTWRRRSAGSPARRRLSSSTTSLPRPLAWTPSPGT